MSRERLNDIIARRKIYQEKKITKPKAAPTPKTVVTTNDELFDFEDEPVQQVVKRAQPPIVPPVVVVPPALLPEEALTEELEVEEVKKVRGRPAGAKSIAPKVEKEELLLPKQSLIRLIKSTGLQHLSADVIEASIEILQSIVENTIIPGGSVTTDVINKHIEKHFASEKDLPEETFLTAPVFQKFVLSFYTPKSATIKRDAFFLLHLYSEAYLLKMISAADIIASSSKRARIQGADLTVAYHIYNL